MGKSCVPQNGPGQHARWYGRQTGVGDYRPLFVQAKFFLSMSGRSRSLWHHPLNNPTAHVEQDLVHTRHCNYTGVDYITPCCAETQSKMKHTVEYGMTPGGYEKTPNNTNPFLHPNRVSFEPARAGLPCGRRPPNKGRLQERRASWPTCGILLQAKAKEFSEL